mmetsp:Transcript_2114/g.3517  ORF Transcript_2114/g.3517 Transcript_2114/m.3517 type:complete len:603 (+) Transcript_2114:1178-2986(+)
MTLLHHQCLHGGNIIQRDKPITIAIEETTKDQRTKVVLRRVVGHREGVDIVELQVDQNGHELLDREAHLLDAEVATFLGVQHSTHVPITHTATGTTGRMGAIGRLVRRSIRIGCGQFRDHPRERLAELRVHKHHVVFALVSFLFLASANGRSGHCLGGSIHGVVLLADQINVGQGGLALPLLHHTHQAGHVGRQLLRAALLDMPGEMAQSAGQIDARALGGGHLGELARQGCDPVLTGGRFDTSAHRRQLAHLVLFLQLLDPGVLQDLRGGDTLERVGVQHLLDQVLGVTGDTVPDLVVHVEIARDRLVDRVAVIRALEWRHATQQDIHYHACGEHIGRATRVVDQQQFGTHITNRAFHTAVVGEISTQLERTHLGGHVRTELLHIEGFLFGFGHAARQAEIGYFYLRIFVHGVKKDVFWLDIEMQNIVLVESMQAADQVACLGGRVVLCKMAFLNDMFIELATRAQGKYQVKLGAHLKHPFNMHDVRMRYVFHNVFQHLCFQYGHFHLGFVLNLHFLHGVTLAVGLVQQFVHDARATHTKDTHFIEILQPLDNRVQMCQTHHPTLFLAKGFCAQVPSRLTAVVDIDRKTVRVAILVILVDH